MPHLNKLYDFTVSAYVLHPTEPKICLHKHRKLSKWLQIGGHVELNEDPLEALEHELLEEIGFKPTDYELIAQPSQPIAHNSKVLPLPFHMEVHSIDDGTTQASGHKHIDSGYLLRAKRTDFEPQEGESTNIKWLTIEEIRQLRADDQLFEGTLDILNWIASVHFKNKA